MLFLFSIFILFYLRYNLNDKPITDESDIIGELVDSQWQAWRNALLQNMWLNNITPEKITYKGL